MLIVNMHDHEIKYHQLGLNYVLELLIRNDRNGTTLLNVLRYLDIGHHATFAIE